MPKKISNSAFYSFFFILLSLQFFGVDCKEEKKVVLCGGMSTSVLENLIAPEVKNDDFYEAIYHLARTENVATILEIGSSSGEGSTEAFVLGIRKNPSKPTLFCMEISKSRFTALQERYKKNPSIKCYNVSSVPLAVFPTEDDVIKFYSTKTTNLNGHSLNTVLDWLRVDIAYVNDSGVPQNGIEIIKNENHINAFDMVLIDGSEFTGIAELNEVYGAKFILLDDINTFKNSYNYNRLLFSTDYQLIKENWSLRNGYAIFKKISK